MVRRLIVIVCLALAACGPAATAGQAPNPTVVTEAPAVATEAATTAPATEAPAQPPEEPASWDKPYDPGSYDDPETKLLCPEDGPADAQPLFGDDTPGILDSQDILIRHGLYVNEQNEIFRIDVIAPSTAQESVDSLNQYISELKVCFDHILMTGITEPIKEPPSGGTVPEPFGSNLADLAIEVYMQGYAGASQSRDAVWEILGGIVKQSVEEWPGRFKENNILSPQDSYPEKVKQDFQIAYIFDPYVAANARHQYVERTASRIYVKASVQYGSGSVTAGLCRNYSLLAGGTMTVTYGTSTHTDSRSDTQSSNYKYDLGVRGRSSGGRYRISGIWGVAGWSAGYYDAAPTGSWYSCNP